MIFISDIIYGSSSSTLEQPAPNSPDMMKNETENGKVDKTTAIPFTIKELKRVENGYCITTCDNKVFRAINMSSTSYLYCFNTKTQLKCTS